MSKSFRIKTQVGEDQKLTFELKQDFDLLEILSLSLTQRDVYTRMCADFGVVVGRVIINNGFGVPNAKVSVFIPLDDNDEKNEVISNLYPFKQPFDKDEDGKRYNLFSAEKNFNCHVVVGTLPILQDILTQQDVEYVYKKYYKFTAKTNESGDFMIYGVPTGAQQLVMDVDLSDIGCFSMLPEDFKIKGYADSDFNGAQFKDDPELDSLPQILNQNKTIEVYPFWGDPEQCQAAITRVDFDLGASGIKLEPSAVFMGSTATDTGKDFINKNCRPKKHMGELCSLITKTGFIDCIRYTPFVTEDPLAYPLTSTSGGTVPVLERYYLANGGRVIDDSGTFLEHIPMNLDHVTTDEFGKMVLSYDPSIGVPTRTRVRFRIRPEQASGSARLSRIGSFLVPNLREYNNEADGDWPGIDYRSYAFSVTYSDYPPDAQEMLIPAAKDYFFDMKFNMVYTPSQFHDHVKHSGRRQFIGIKEILPEAEQQCSTTAMHFPVNSAVRRNKFIIAMNNLLLSVMYGLYSMLIALTAFLGIIISIILFIVMLLIFIVCKILCLLIPAGFTLGWPFYWSWYPFSGLASTANQLGCSRISWPGNGSCGPPDGCVAYGFNMGIVLFSLNQTKYPDCERCTCRPAANSDLTSLSNSTWCTYLGNAAPPNNVSPCASPPQYGVASIWDMSIWGEQVCCSQADREGQICCPDHYGWDSTTTSNTEDGAAGGGCYVKIICFRLACIGMNFKMKVLKEYIRREKISSALCNGVMNYFWENNWVSGFLYQYQFKAKMKYKINAFTGYDGEVYDTYTDSIYCKKTVYVHPIDHVFYYRSTPFRNGAFIGDDDGVYSPWWQAGSTSSFLHASGDMDRHILFPTSIVNMGSRNQCIQEICLDPEFSTDCSVTDQIGSTTFQDITDLVSDIYNIKMNKSDLVLRSFFNRPEKEIGGDVAQALMQNSMLGIYGYESNEGDTECDCNVAVTTTPANMGMLEYPPPCDTILANTSCPTYTQYAINITGNDYNIHWEPLMYTASTPVIMAGADLWSCVTIDLSASSQTVPFYPWMVKGGVFGTYMNDWAGTIGDYIYPTANALGWNVGGAVFGTDEWVGSGGPYGIYAGNYQYYMSLIGGGPPGLPEPLAPFPTGTQEVNFSRPLFFYFGLRPGRTAYNTFVTKYIDEELGGTVI
tara:strand:+ start:2532 stop:6029 length:3498 start_codon:yes stop_codon:yes gene_type:complete